MSVKKFISVILVSIAFCLSFNVAKAATAEELLKEIARLQALIAQLQKQLAEIQGKPTTWCHDFNVNLKIGDTGDEVYALQIALEKEGLFPPPGGIARAETQIPTFGEYTASAVVGFQEKYKDEILTPLGLIHGTGVVGPATRAKLNKLYGCGVVPPPEKPYIKVLSPNGGEIWKMGNTYEVTWVSAGVDKVDISYLNMAIGLGQGIGATGVPASLGKYSFTVPTDDPNVRVGDKYKVYIRGKTPDGSRIEDWSDNYFSIVAAPSITSLSSNSGTANDTITIYGKNLISTKPSGIYIEFLKNGVQEGTISSPIYVQPDGLSLKFTLSGIFVANTEPGTYQIRVVNDYGKSNTVDFTILGSTYPSITVISPNGGEQWMIGSTYNISWKSTGVDKVDIELEKWEGVCQPCSWIIAENVPAYLESYLWKIPTGIGGAQLEGVSPSSFYKIYVEDSKHTYINDKSDNYFSIVSAPAACTDSDGGKNYYQKGTVTEDGKIYTDYCQGAFYLKEYFCLPYSVGGVGGVAEEDVVCPNGSSCKDGACVATPSITVLSPNGGEVWKVGETKRVSWTASGVNYVRIYVYDPTISGSGSTNYIYDGFIPASKGYYDWTIIQNQLPGGSSLPRNYKIRIDGVNEAYIGAPVIISDTSDNYFSIVSAEGLVDGYNHYCFTLSDIKKGTTINFNYTSIDDPYLRYFMISIDCPEAQGKRWYTSSGCSSSGCSTGKYCNIGTGYSGKYSYTFDSDLPGTHQICTWPSSDYKTGTTEIYKWKVEKSIAQPTITVIYPNGGERWIFGVPQTIKWTSSGIEKGKTIGLYLMSTENLACLIGKVDVSAGEYTVTLQENQPCPNPYFPKLVPGKYKLSIDAAAATGIENFGDNSDDYFTIVESETVDGYNHGCFTFSDIPAGLVLGFNYTSIDDPYLRYFMIGIDCPEANGKRWYTSSGCVQCSGGGKYCNIGTGYSGTYYYTFSSSLAGQHTICTWPSSDYKPGSTDIYKWKMKMSASSGLGFIKEQLASISQVASWLVEQVKKLIGR